MISKPRWFSVVVFLVFGSSAVWAAEPIQTQMGMSGDMEVDVVRAAVHDDILTVVLAYRNTGQKAAKVQYPIDDVYYIDETEKKKYHVLKDSKGDWIAAPTARGMLGTEASWGAAPVEIPPGGKKVAWFKFPAPAAATKTINLVVPETLPFEKLPVAR
jgi:hypothetical protein